MFRQCFRIFRGSIPFKLARYQTLTLSLLWLDYMSLNKPRCFIQSSTPFSPLTFTNIYEKNKQSIVILYSKQTNRPVGSGVILNTYGVFVTVTEIISDKESSGQFYAKLMGSDQHLKFDFVSNLDQEGISICQIAQESGSHYAPIQISSNKIGEQIYCISKDYNDINLFDSSIVLSDNYSLNIKLINNDVLTPFAPFIVMNHTVPMLSGSPVFNQSGYLVGLLRRDEFLTDKQVAIQASFLIPIIDQLSKNNQFVKRSFAGLTVKTSENGGAFIIRLSSDGPAEQAGIKLGEIIKSINQTPIIHAADVCKILGYNRNQKMEFLVDRDGKLRTVYVTTQ